MPNNAPLPSSSGILIYEMLAGYPPFFDDNPFGIYEKILGGRVEWPRHLEATAKDLVKKLLTQDRTKRLGNMKVRRERISDRLWPLLWGNCGLERFVAVSCYWRNFCNTFSHD